FSLRNRKPRERRRVHLCNNLHQPRSTDYIDPASTGLFSPHARAGSNLRSGEPTCPIPSSAPNGPYRSPGRAAVIDPFCPGFVGDDPEGTVNGALPSVPPRRRRPVRRAARARDGLPQGGPSDTEGAFSLLRYLVERSGRLVTHAELLEKSLTRD